MGCRVVRIEGKILTFPIANFTYCIGKNPALLIDGYGYKCEEMWMRLRLVERCRDRERNVNIMK